MMSSSLSRLLSIAHSRALALHVHTSLLFVLIGNIRPKTNLNSNHKANVNNSSDEQNKALCKLVTLLVDWYIASFYVS